MTDARPDAERNEAPRRAPSDPTREPGQEVATVDPKPLARLEADGRDPMAIIPRTVEEATRYAGGIIAAGIVPQAFRHGGRSDGEPNRELIVMGVLKGLEVGLPPQTALGALLPINGRFTIWGDGAVALAQQAGLVTSYEVEEVGDAPDNAADIKSWPGSYGIRVTIGRKGQTTPYVGEFTVAEAIRANLWANHLRKPWVLYPKRMLLNRARAFALRDGFADCLSGLAIREEIEDAVSPAPMGALAAPSRTPPDASGAPPIDPRLLDAPEASAAPPAPLTAGEEAQSVGETTPDPNPDGIAPKGRDTQQSEFDDVI